MRHKFLSLSMLMLLSLTPVMAATSEELPDKRFVCVLEESQNGDYIDRKIVFTRGDSNKILFGEFLKEKLTLQETPTVKLYHIRRSDRDGGEPTEAEIIAILKTLGLCEETSETYDLGKLPLGSVKCLGGGPEEEAVYILKVIGEFLQTTQYSPMSKMIRSPNTVLEILSDLQQSKVQRQKRR